jgi:hypothetical protein|tara:strand:- start:126 stop:668 length:543 start_codon:yes stop_codon:yes gene_type:complete
MSKEKLRHATLIEALNEYKKTINSSSMYQEKDVQETIYQIEDLANGQAVVLNKNYKPKTITGSIYIEPYDIYKMYKHFITGVSTPALKTNLQDCASKTPVYTSVSMKSFDGWSKERKVEEVILHFIDTLDFCITDIHRNFLTTIQTKVNGELSRRIATEEAEKKAEKINDIIKDNIDENK